jgi:tRNA 2-thiouridine synthesizing protein A
MLVHLTASDPAAPAGLPAWCHLTGHAYLGAVPAHPDVRAAHHLRPRHHRPGFPLAPRLS